MFKHIERVIAWIEKQGYKIISIDTLIVMIKDKGLFNPYYENTWYKDISTMLCNGVIKEGE